MRDYSGIKIGSRFNSLNWGTVEVIDIVERKPHRDLTKVRIKFINTGNERVSRYKEVRLGSVKDVEAAKSGVQPTNPYKSPKRDAALLPIGSTYKTNLYGMVEVVEYVNSKNITVKFLDTGNICKVQRDALLKGLVQDVELKEKNIENKKKESEASKAAWEAKLKYWEDLRLAEEARKQAIKEERRQAREASRLHSRMRLVGKRYTDNLGHEFEVVASAGSASWEIKYIETGSTYTVKEGWMLKGGVYDRCRLDFEELYSQWSSKKAALSYERNREVRIAQASQYQRDNKDKTQVRNRNRRARRINAEGSHTLEETIQLLLNQDYKCIYCKEDLHKERHLDHIMPLALGGTNYIENLQWLCPFCNLSKSDRHPDEWEAYRLSPEYAERLSMRNI